MAYVHKRKRVRINPWDIVIIVCSIGLGISILGMLGWL